MDMKLPKGHRLYRFKFVKQRYGFDVFQVPTFSFRPVVTPPVLPQGEKKIKSGPGRVSAGGCIID